MNNEIKDFIRQKYVPTLQYILQVDEHDDLDNSNTDVDISVKNNQINISYHGVGVFSAMTRFRSLPIGFSVHHKNSTIIGSCMFDNKLQLKDNNLIAYEERGTIYENYFSLSTVYGTQCLNSALVLDELCPSRVIKCNELILQYALSDEQYKKIYKDFNLIVQTHKKYIK